MFSDLRFLGLLFRLPGFKVSFLCLGFRVQGLGFRF